VTWGELPQNCPKRRWYFRKVFKINGLNGVTDGARTRFPVLLCAALCSKALILKVFSLLNYTVLNSDTLKLAPKLAPKIDRGCGWQYYIMVRL
jgi:hypothetical protein